MIVGGLLHGHVWLGQKVAWEELEDGVVLLDVIGFSDAKPFWCAELVEVTPILWKGSLVSEHPPGFSVVVRPTVENDTAAAISFADFAPYPLPIPAVRDIVREGVFEAPRLFTAWDERRPAGMFLFTDVGGYFRAGGAWHELDDATVMVDFELRDASREDLIAFDKQDPLASAIVWPPVEPRRRR